jgi:1-acyl-sn-glycerol-3-phosphate acyltransferase
MQSKKAYPTKYYIRFVAFIVFSIFTFIYRIKRKLPSEVKNLKSPCLIIGNHIGSWDPFVVGHFLPRFTHFVASDAVFREKVLRFFFTRLGTIPIKKSMRDTKVIRDIVAVIRQGENVGIFPEALRNWAGSSFPIDKSTVKLIKLLKVPVVVAVLKGMNLFNPRWAYRLRPTRVEVEYKLLLNQQQILTLNEDEIFDILKKSIFHNEVAYQRTNMNKIHSKYKAEYINHALYVCPECKTIESLRVKGNDFECNICNFDIHIDDYGFFKRISKGKLHFDNILDWYHWENSWMTQYISNLFDNHYQEAIFEDINSEIYHSEYDANLDFLGIADVRLYIDRIEILFINKNDSIVLNYNDLQIINPQKNERIEIYYNNEAYRIIGSRKGVSGLKWEVAVNAIWKKMGQVNKLSTYLQNRDFKPIQKQCFRNKDTVCKT